MKLKREHPPSKWTLNVDLRLFTLGIVQLLFILGGPFLCLTYALGYIYKRIIILWSVILGKDFEEPIQGQELLFASDDFNGKPTSPLCGIFYLEGIPSKDEIVRDLWKVYNERDKKTNEKIYWRLACYPVNWMGYWFWKKADFFDIESQIEVIDGDRSTDFETKFVEKFIRRPFPKRGALWGMALITNYCEDPNKSVLVYRTSHLLYDGLSFVKFYFKLSGIRKLPPSFPTMKVVKATFKEKIMFGIEFYTTGLFQYLRTLKAPDNNPILNANTKHTGVWSVVLGPTISMDSIKKARAALGCTFFDICLSAVIGGLREYILQNHPQELVPKTIQSILPTPKPNHPDNTFINHWYTLTLELPIRISDPLDRTREIGKVMKTSTETPYSAVLDMVLAIIATFPIASFTNKLTDFQGFTMVSSASPLAQEMPPFFGCSVTDAYYWVSIARENVAALTWSTFTLNGFAQVGLLADTACIPDRKLLKVLGVLIEQEFDRIFASTKALTAGKIKQN